MTMVLNDEMRDDKVFGYEMPVEGRLSRMMMILNSILLTKDGMKNSLICNKDGCSINP